MNERQTDAVELSVVIPVRDAADLLPEQLDALVGQEWAERWEVVVVDNLSRDTTPAVVCRYAEQYERVRLVRAGNGSGAAYARNVGARLASGRALAFCDADDVVAVGWVAAMGDALRRHDFVTGPLELDRLNPAWLVDSRGRRHVGQLDRYEGLFPYASSCNLGIRREFFEGAGGFDASYVVGEDIELSLRLWLAGVELHFEPAAVVHYRYRPTLGSTYRQARSYGRVRPVLAERLRRSGRGSPKHSAGLRNWAWLVRHAPLLSTGAGRAKWVWVAGQRVGNLEGSFRVRRLYF